MDNKTDIEKKIVKSIRDETFRPWDFRWYGCKTMDEFKELLAELLDSGHIKKAPTVDATGGFGQVHKVAFPKNKEYEITEKGELMVGIKLM